MKHAKALPQSIDLKTLTAIYEAGHAVLAYRHSIPFTYVTVDRAEFGEGFFATRPWSHKLNDYGSSNSIDRHLADETLVLYLSLSIAGTLAESPAMGRRGCKGMSSGDAESIDRVFEYCGIERLRKPSTVLAGSLSGRSLLRRACSRAQGASWPVQHSAHRGNDL